ncbi:signal transduction histidine kinase [Sphingomonas zeicaulis]
MTEMDQQEAASERRFSRRVLLLMVAGFAAMLLAGIAAALVLLRTQEQTQWVNHSFDVERQIAQIRLSVEEMRTARRGEVLRIRMAPHERYAAAAARLDLEIDAASRLTADNPRQQGNIAELRRLADHMDSLFKRSLRPGQRGAEADEAARQAAARAVVKRADAMLDAERALFAERDGDRRESTEILYGVLALAAILIIVTGIGSLTIVRRYTRTLVSSRNALAELNDSLEDAVAERTVDLQRANDEIQRFAYIVSHDLRSPLVNVMGFTAELDASIKPMRALLDQVDAEAPAIASAEARQAVDEDLPEAIGFIRTSTQKMDRLINAILRLSREGRRTISPERLDMNALVHGIVDGLRHRIDELGVTVDIATDLPDVVSDRLAIEQILSNLVENAVKYLKPGRPGLIRITGQVKHGRAMIDVVDNGRGIEKRDHDRIFDLFRRSGVQDQQGEGIGLAHVRALAYRLGGTIGVESEFGEGSTFTLNIPVHFMGDRGPRP